MSRRLLGSVIRQIRVVRLLRYCARPVFALERLRQIDAEHLVYESVKSGPGAVSASS